MRKTLTVASGGTAADAFERRAWTEVYACLADAGEPLSADNNERLAVAAYLLGKDDESAHAWERAYRGFVADDDPDHAARCCFWLALTQLLAGNSAVGGGWLGRLGHLVDAVGRDCAARGYLLVPNALQEWNGDDSAAAYALYTEAGEVAARFGDTDLAALACLGQGQALLTGNETTRGVALLDEAMVRVTTGEVSPVPAGIIYCAVIEACFGVFDLRRATEWTEALSSWCAAQPDLVPYRGQCLVYRSQILQLRGEWPQAITAAGLACERLSQPTHAALGRAAYQRAELHRLRGEFQQAEAVYRQASQYGHEPVPGLALLRLTEGNVTAASATISRAADDSHDPFGRPAVLAAQVEIMLSAGDVGAARDGADELAAIAREVDAPFLHAIAAHAEGSTLLAEGDVPAALAALRRAVADWRTLEMPYESARTRVQIGLAYRALGDHDSAALEFDSAREIFDRLGARPDMVSVTALVKAAARPDGPLTRRECEVLRLVAAGNTNRGIATQLVLSEYTVARHLQNIFAKLGLSSRAAATAYAYEHRLIDSGG